MKAFFAPILCLMLILSTVFSQPANTKYSLDAFVDWTDPLAITEPAFRQKARDLSNKPEEPIYRINDKMSKAARAVGMVYLIDPDKLDKNWTLFSGEVDCANSHVSFTGDKCTWITFDFGTKRRPAIKEGEVKKIRELLNKVTGDTKPVTFQRKIGNTNNTQTETEWKAPKYFVQLYESTKDHWRIIISGTSNQE